GYTLGTAITSDGSYVLTVTDLAGNSTVLNFSIDTVAPVVTGLTDNQLYTSAVTPSSTDTDIQTVTLTKNGSTVAGYTLGTAITADGSYVLTVTDIAGNSTVFHFGLDTVAPVVSGVIDNHIYGTSVTPSSADTDIQTVTLTKNGTAVAGYTLGTVVTLDGAYVLTVTDQAGNSTVYNFSIDKVAPVITGITDNQLYNSTVTPSSTDTDIQTVTLTKNGSAVAGYTLGTAITVDGSYVLTVTDVAGNTTVLHFGVDTTAPVVTGVLENQTYATTVTPSSSDSDIQTVTLTKNGTAVAGYTLGTAISQHGTYVLTVTDQAGNSTVLHFSLDTVAPVITGVTENQLYATAVTPTSSDSDIQTVTLTKNGTAVAGYTLGTAISADGTYVLTVTDQVGNTTVLHFSIDQTAPVVTGVIDNQLYNTTVTPTSSDTDIQTVTLTKNGTGVAGYTLGTAISQSGSYVLTVTDQAGNSTVKNFSIDTVAPVVTGVLDNQLYAAAVTPTSSDTDIQTVSLTKNGTVVAGYTTLGTAITQDGVYVLTVTDQAGNSTVLNFSIDTTAPVISGLIDNHIYTSSITPSSSDTDIQTVLLTKNGSAIGYTLGTAITTDGNYVLSVTDQAGNTTVFHVSIDTLAPVVTGVLDNQSYASTVTPTSSDSDIQTLTLTRDGTAVAGYALGTAITADGTYVLTATDLAGNSTVVHFIIDTAAPSVTGVIDNQLYNVSVTPSSTDTDIQATQLTRNGSTVAGYTLGTAITADGTYVLTVTDLVGNTTVLHFSIDQTAPVVTGVIDNQLYNTSVTPFSSDSDIQSVTLTKNGTAVAGYTLGTAVSTDGTYVLTVLDLAGNSTVLHFTIDKVAPVITGVIENNLYNTSVTPSSSDTDIQTVTLTQNGTAVVGYALGTPIASNGTYVLTVTDLAGNSTVYHFSIDTTAPVIAGVVDNQVYASSVTPTSSDSDIQTVTLTKNGSAVGGYTLGTAVTQHGTYVLTVTDLAGNSTVYHFSIDTMAPVITGVIDNHLYAASVTPTSADTDIQTTTLTKNGTAVAGYVLGTAITADGSYVLTVVDQVGNSTVLHFSIDQTAPVVTGILNNQLYNAAVTPSSADTDIQTTTLTKNGSTVAGYTLGTAVSQNGSYVLTVTDQAGNSTVLNFSIDTTAPVVTGIVNSQLYNTSVTPTSADSDIQTVTLTKNGSAVAGYTLGTAITTTGTYVLTVTDLAGNSTVVNFGIDKVAPVVTGVLDNQLYNTSVTPSSADTDIQTVTLTKNGSTVGGYALGTAVTTNGTYVLTVTDQAGNSTVLNFSIDTTVPVVAGVIENQVYATSVTPTSGDTDIQTVTLTKNGSAVGGYTLGTAITTTGTYVLTVTDLAGNSTILHFRIDKAAPVVTGVLDNSLYNTSVTPSSSDSDIQTVALTQNGSTVAGYTLGTAVTTNGVYVLTVTDQVGNSIVLHFTIDKTAPVITGVVENQSTNAPVTPTSSDSDIQTVTLTKNGSAVAGYTLGTAINQAGTYVLTVVDQAGNSTVVHFIYDTTAPVITGVTNNQLYNTSVTPNSADSDLQTIALTKNGSTVAGYTLGTAVTQNGTYVLTVTDKAGNSTVMNFTIDTTAPVVTGVVNGQTYTAWVTPASSDTDIQTVNLKKGGTTVAGYTLGTTVKLNGTYILTVTDQAGNATVVNFTMSDTTAPTVTGVADTNTYTTSVTPASSDVDIQTVTLTRYGTTVAGYALGTAITTPGSYVLTVTDLNGNSRVVNFYLRLSYEESDTTYLSYAGSWSPAGNASNNGGNAKYSGTAGSSYTITFTGTYIQIFGYKAANNGIADIYLDGSKVATYDFYNSPNIYKLPIYSASGLTAGPHTVQVVYTGTKNASSSGMNIDLDYFIIQ
ncbi:beta strand repeat-containing protein, partial [Tumebacillus permanentifrigoris]